MINVNRIKESTLVWQLLEKCHSHVRTISSFVFFMLSNFMKQKDSKVISHITCTKSDRDMDISTHNKTHFVAIFI